MRSRKKVWLATFPSCYPRNRALRRSPDRLLLVSTMSALARLGIPDTADLCALAQVVVHALLHTVWEPGPEVVADNLRGSLGVGSAKSSMLQAT